MRAIVLIIACLGLVGACDGEDGTLPPESGDADPGPDADSLPACAEVCESPAAFCTADLVCRCDGVMCRGGDPG